MAPRGAPGLRGESAPISPPQKRPAGAAYPAVPLSVAPGGYGTDGATARTSLLLRLSGEPRKARVQ